MSWGQHATLHGMIVMSRLYQTNMLRGIGILLEHCDNTPRVDHDNIILIPSQPVFTLCSWLRIYHRITNIKLNNKENNFNSDIE